MISNPKYKGEWKPKKIPNPAYKGVWKAKEIPNPEYEADDKLHIYQDFAAVTFDLWQVKSGTIFDNVILADSYAEAKAFYDETNGATKETEKKAYDELEENKRKAEEEDRKKQVCLCLHILCVPIPVCDQSHPLGGGRTAFSPLHFGPGWTKGRWMEHNS